MNCTCACVIVLCLALFSQTLDLSTDKLEKLLFVAEAIEDNLHEFNWLTKNISRVVQEVKMLAILEEDVASSCSDDSRSRLSISPPRFITSSSSETNGSIVSINYDNTQRYTRMH